MSWKAFSLMSLIIVITCLVNMAHIYSSLFQHTCLVSELFDQVSSKYMWWIHLETVFSYEQHPGLV